MANDNDGSSFGDIAALGTGAGVGYWQFKKIKKTNQLSQTLDPRSSLLSRIQNIRLDKAYDTAIKRFETDWALSRLSEFESRLRGNRGRALEAFNARNARLFDMDPIAITPRSMETTQLIRREWEAAVAATFPNPLESKVFQSTSDPLDAIRLTLRSNSSVLTQRAFFTFQSNVEKLLNRGAEAPFAGVAASTFIKGIPDIMASTEVGLGGIQDVRLRTTIEQIQTALGRPLSVAHRGVAGQGEFTFGFAGKEGTLFRIPEAFAGAEGTRAGLIRTGAGLHNVYAPGVFGVVNEANQIVDEMTFSQLKAQRIYNQILEQNLTGRTPGLKNVLGNIETEIGKLAPYMEPNIGGTPYSFETIFSSHQMTVLDASGSPVTGDVRRAVAERMYTQGKFTPTGSGSTFSLYPETEIYGPFAAELDYARKPWQRIRQHSLTESAIAANKASPFAGAEFDFLDSPVAMSRTGGPSGARLKTLYLNEDQIATLQKNFNMTIGDGELLLHESTKRKLQVSRIKRVNLNELNSDVADLFMQRGYKLDNLTQQMSMDIPVTGILGRNAEGKLITTTRPTSVVGISPTVTERLDKTKRASLDLLIREQIDMSNVEKVFGSLKGEARFIQYTPELTKAFGEMGLDLTGIEAIARVGDIKDVARQKQAALAASLIGSAFDIKGGGVSVSQLNFGGEAALTGAGNIGTLEPRVFTLLAGSNPGGLGDDITTDFLQRMTRWAPERMTMHTELMKTLGSIAGDIRPSGDVFSVSDLANRDKLALLKAKGGLVQTGIDPMPHIYMPGYETVPELHPRMVGTGAVVETSQPSKIFDQILGDIRAANRAENPLTQQEFLGRMEAAKTGYLNQLVQEAAIAGKGAGSIARGELAGSRALTVLSEANPADQAAFAKSVQATGLPANIQDRVIGLPKSQAAEMFSEMERLYGTQAVAGMRQRFEAGEVIAGMGMRHPTIGPYSMQPVLFKSVDIENPGLLVSERMESLSLSGSKGIFTKSIQTGILPGWAADKDADTALAMLLSPEMEEKMRAQITNVDSALNSQFQSYRDHSIRMQLLKPKANPEAITLANAAQMRAAEATKLAMTSEQVGILSSNLTKSRVALMASSLPETRKLRGLSLLEWLEQQPISGKHLSVSKALSGAFEQQMQALSMGAQGNARLLEGSIAAITEGTVKPELMDLFGEGMDIVGGGRVEGFKLGETTGDIATAIQQMRALPEGAQLAAAAKYSSPSASGAVKIADLSAVLMANQINKGSAGLEMSRNALAAINQDLSTVVNKARPYLKPLALAAVAGGLTAAILSPGPGTMATGGVPPPPAQSSNPNRDDISIPGIANQQLGSPSVTPQLQQRATLSETEGAQRRKSIRARIQANNVTPQQRQSLTERLSNRYPGSHINVNMRDDRRTLNPHSVNDILDT